MRNLGVYLTDEELELMMKEADEDGNGVIDFQGKGSTPVLTAFFLLTNNKIFSEFRRVILPPPTPPAAN